MPRLTPEGYRVHYYAYPSTDAKGFRVEALFRRALMMAELVMRDDLTTGDIIVLDLANGSAARLRDFTLAMTLLSKFVRGGLVSLGAVCPLVPQPSWHPVSPQTGGILVTALTVSPGRKCIPSGCGSSTSSTCLPSCPR